MALDRYKLLSLKDKHRERLTNEELKEKIEELKSEKEKKPSNIKVEDGKKEKRNDKKR